MKKNVGGVDQIARIVVGVILLALAVMGIGAPWTYIGILPLLTGLMGWCPAYPLLGINSCKAPSKE